MIPSIFNPTFILDGKRGRLYFSCLLSLVYRHSFVCGPSACKHDGRGIISIHVIFDSVPEVECRVMGTAAAPAGRAWLGFPKGKVEAV
jgi:hypothetical protein